MSATRTADQRAAFVRSTAADLDVAPDLAERLLALSEAARARERTGPLDDRLRRRLLATLTDDELCRHVWWVAAAEGEPLWRELLDTAQPPHDVGPTVSLAVALAARGAPDEAFLLVHRLLRAGVLRRSVLELGIDLAEDAGQAGLAWSWAERLDAGTPEQRWADLRCAAGRGGQASGCGPAGVAHARWLRRRIHRWARRSWSPLPDLPPDPIEDTTAPAADPVAAAAVAYLRGRRSLLPAGERDLLGLWARTARRYFSVVRVGRHDLVLDDGGRRCLAGWEGDPPPTPTVDGWLLPTLAAGHALFVSSSRPPDDR
jgi:hypothetical protein